METKRYDVPVVQIHFKMQGLTIGSVARALKIDRSRISHQLNESEPFRLDICEALEDLLGVARGGLLRRPRAVDSSRKVGQS